MLITSQKFRSHTLGYYPRHQVQHVRNLGPILFALYENIAHVMPCATACAVTSWAHCMAHAHRKAGRPNYTWHTKIYLWMCRLRRPNDIYQN